MGSKSKCTGKGLIHKKAQKAPKIFLCLLCLFVATVAQTPAPPSYVLRPARIFVTRLSRCGSRAQRITFATRSGLDSQQFAIWERNAPVPQLACTLPCL